jgi:hypothetical protein
MVSGPFFIVRRMVKRLRVPVANDFTCGIPGSNDHPANRSASSALTGELLRFFCPACLALFIFYYLSGGATTSSPISLLYSAMSDGEQYISRISKPRGCNRSGKLFRASHGSVYIFGSSIFIVSCIWS